MPDRAIFPADDGYRVEVYILASRKDLYRLCPDAPEGAAACTQVVADGPTVARLMLCRGLVSPAVVAHELFHALLSWAVRAGVTDEEQLAGAMGRMAGQLAEMVS